MKATLFFVSDDTEAVNKLRAQFETDPTVQLQVYTPQQWSTVLEDSGTRSNLHNGVPTLTGGVNASGGAKVIPFTQPNSYSPRVEKMEELEAKAISDAIQQYKGNLTEAAKALGIGRATLYRKVKQFNIDPAQARRRRAA